MLFYVLSKWIKLGKKLERQTKFKKEAAHRMWNGAMEWNCSGRSSGLQNLRLSSPLCCAQCIHYQPPAPSHPHLSLIRQTKCSIMKTWHEEISIEIKPLTAHSDVFKSKFVLKFYKTFCGF